MEVPWVIMWLERLRKMKAEDQALDLQPEGGSRCFFFIPSSVSWSGLSLCCHSSLSLYCSPPFVHGGVGQGQGLGLWVQVVGGGRMSRVGWRRGRGSLTLWSPPTPRSVSDPAQRSRICFGSLLQPCICLHCEPYLWGEGGEAGAWGRVGVLEGEGGEEGAG